MLIPENRIFRVHKLSPVFSSCGNIMHTLSVYKNNIIRTRASKLKGSYKNKLRTR